MACKNRIFTLFFLTACATLVSASPTSAQDSWKLYDLRDLIELLPQPRPEATPIPQDTIYGSATVVSRVPERDPVDELIQRLCDDLEADYTLLYRGVYGVSAEEDGHSALINRLERVRELYTQRYDVEILWFSILANQSPSIGDSVNPDEPLHRDRLVVTRRTPAQITQVDRHAYVSGISPVVGTGAIGYASETDIAESGLQLSILVGSGRETETATSIRIRGELRRVAMGKMSGPVTTLEARSMEIELPEVRVRSIQSNIHIQFGKLTALAVLDGFNTGDCVVVAASVVPRLAD